MIPLFAIVVVIVDRKENILLHYIGLINMKKRDLRFVISFTDHFIYISLVIESDQTCYQFKLKTFSRLFASMNKQVYIFN